MYRPPEVTVVGAGVAGLTAAMALAERGARVTVHERSRRLGEDACSWLAGGMLAPWCEADGAEPEVTQRGEQALSWWARHVPDVRQRGSLVLAAPRDGAELTRFAARTTRHAALGADAVAALEPDLQGRFDRGLYFADEAHLDPRQALPALADALQARGVVMHFNSDIDPSHARGDYVVDCRGLSARPVLPGLRGVRGEMLLLRSRDIRLCRPVRLLHPRLSVYVVPRGEGVLMLGATSIETDHAGPVTVRSAWDLLGAAYALHPALAEAEIIECGAGVRPAFDDHLPRVEREGRIIRFNGLYRHGFLLSPWYAQRVADHVLPAREEAA